MYKGAKYIGIDPVRVGKGGVILNPGDVFDLMPEWEAKGRPDFEPVYSGKQPEEKTSFFDKKKKKEDKK
jgi:hypothetical protein